MCKEQAEKRAQELFESGLHCAEAVLLASLHGAGEAGARYLACAPQAAAAFGGGVGRCKQELCGALSGGLIALGLLRGRPGLGGGWDELAGLVAELRRRFIEEFGSSRCHELLERFGPQEGMDKCIALTGKTAGMIQEALARA